jgi:CSLREA domain-containing protein
VVELDGTATTTALGLHVLTGPGSRIAGFSIGDYTRPLVAQDRDTVIVGNWVGVAADGVTTYPVRPQEGIRIVDIADATIVGGSAAQDRNVVVDAHNAAVYVSDSNAVVIRNNLLGMLPDGITPAPNGLGIDVAFFSGDLVIGGGPGQGNVISGNTGDGIRIGSASPTSRIEGNRIGVDATDAAAGNAGAGIRITAAGAGLTVADNVIAHNGAAGVIDTAGGHTVLGNELRDNGGLGIDLGDDGVTTAGAPVIANVQRVAGNLVAEFELDVSAGTHRIEIFANTAADPSGYGEGETLLHAETITHTGSGTEAFTLTFPSAPVILTATATTDLGSGSYGATSEFSAAVPSPDLVVVNSTGDAGDAATGDGQCATGSTIAGGAPECTLRAAIDEANDPATPVDTIWFAIPASDAGHTAGVWTITPATVDLPSITDTVTIDGSTQPGWTTDPVVVLDGSAITGDTHGLYVAVGADDSAIGHLSMVSWTGDAMQTHADRVRIQDMFIGVLPDGVTAPGNTTEGIIVTGNDTEIRGSVIGASGNGAITLNGASTGSVIAGNHIGTDRSGTVDFGNLQGVWSDTTGGGIVGGTDPADANVIANSAGPGVEIRTAGSAVTVIGNEIRDNARLGLDLVGGTESAAGVTANDPGDTDIGPNGLLNHPEIATARLTGGVVDLTYTLDAPAGDYRIEFYDNPGGTDPSGHGEGERLVGVATISHPGGGTRTFTHSVAGAIGSAITATATEILGGGPSARPRSSPPTSWFTDPAADRVIDESVRRSDLDGRGGADTSTVPGIAGNAITLTGGTQRLVGPASTSPTPPSPWPAGSSCPQWAPTPASSHAPTPAASPSPNCSSTPAPAKPSPAYASAAPSPRPAAAPLPPAPGNTSPQSGTAPRSSSTSTVSKSTASPPSAPSQPTSRHPSSSATPAPAPTACTARSTTSRSCTAPKPPTPSPPTSPTSPTRRPSSASAANKPAPPAPGPCPPPRPAPAASPPPHPRSTAPATPPGSPPSASTNPAWSSPAGGGPAPPPSTSPPVPAPAPCPPTNTRPPRRSTVQPGATHRRHRHPERRPGGFARHRPLGPGRDLDRPERRLPRPRRRHRGPRLDPTRLRADVGLGGPTRRRRPRRRGLVRRRHPRPPPGHPRTHHDVGPPRPRLTPLGRHRRGPRPGKPRDMSRRSVSHPLTRVEHMYDSPVSTLARPADAITGEPLPSSGSASSAADAAPGSLADVPLDDLVDDLRTWAAHITAAEAHWLDLVAEFCRREGHRSWGLTSPAHWLAWQCSLSAGTAREHVRVALALQDLPVIRAHFAAGRISYSKVRAITRIADPDNETALVRLALNGTAAQVERTISAWIGAINRDDPDREAVRYQRRGVTRRYNEYGNAVVIIETAPENSDRIIDSIDELLDDIDPGPFDDPSAAPPEKATLTQRRADAFMALIDDRTGTRHGADRIRASIDIDLRALTHNADGTCQVRNGPSLSAETARRLTCDAELELFHTPAPAPHRAPAPARRRHARAARPAAPAAPTTTTKPRRGAPPRPAPRPGRSR